MKAFYAGQVEVADDMQAADGEQVLAQTEPVKTSFLPLVDKYEQVTWRRTVFMEKLHLQSVVRVDLSCLLFGDWLRIKNI